MDTSQLKHIPNIISVLRIILVIPIMIAFWNEDYKLAFVLILIAGISDGVDGFLARFFNWRSRLGAILDPLADKILLICLFVVFAMKGLLPLWLMYLVVGRDIIILLGGFIYNFFIEKIEISPLFISKINTTLQIALVLLVALKLASIQIAPWILNGMIILVTFSTLISGISYVVIWARLALHSKNVQQSLNKY